MCICRKIKISTNRSFWGFADHFKDQADALLNNLEPAKQKAIQGEFSGSSSNGSLHSAEGYRAKPAKPHMRSASTDRGNYESSTLGCVLKCRNN